MNLMRLSEARKWQKLNGGTSSSAQTQDNVEFDIDAVVKIKDVKIGDTNRKTNKPT